MNAYTDYLREMHRKSPGLAIQPVVSKMVSLEHFSTPLQTELMGKMTENANNKIPEYAREYKKEYLFIRGLNKIEI